MEKNRFTEITPEIQALAELCKENGSINPELYTKYEVKRGLRDINGKGVLAGLTEIRGPFLHHCGQRNDPL